MDTFYFFTAILGGLGDAIKWYYLSMIALLIAQCRLNVPCLPGWFLKYKYFDDFHKSYMSYVYLYHVHNNPIASTIAYHLIESVNSWKSKLKQKADRSMKNWDENGLKTKEELDLELSNHLWNWPKK